LPYYSFVITKGDITLELESTNSKLVAQEIKKWLDSIEESTSSKSAKAKKSTSSKTPNKKEDTAKEEKIVRVDESKEDKIPVEETQVIQLEATIKEEIIIEAIEEPKEKTVLFDTEDMDLEDIEKIKALEEAIKNVSKTLKDSNKEKPIIQQEAEEIIIDEKTVIVEEKIIEDQQEESTKDNFSDILQKKVASLPEKVGKMISEVAAEAFKEDDSDPFKELINQKNPESMLDYLLITAHYLKEYEKLDRYSLKQINAKTVSFTKQLIDHSIIQKAVSQDYLEVVPDFTGMAGVTEYKITDDGESYVLNEL